jgi:hypothetical protein
LERYGKAEFVFYGYENGKFTFSFHYYSSTYGNDKVTVVPLEGKMVRGMMTFRELISISSGYPEMMVDEDFLINLFGKMEKFWNRPFLDFVKEYEGVFGFEEMVCIRRVIHLHPKFKLFNSIYNVKFYQAASMLQTTDIRFLDKVCGCFGESVLQKLNDIGLILQDQALLTPTQQ